MTFATFIHNSFLLPLIILTLAILTSVFSWLFYLHKKESHQYLVEGVLSLINLIIGIVTFALYKIMIQSVAGQISYFVLSILSLIFVSYFNIFHLVYGFYKYLEYNLFTKAINNTKWDCYLVLSKYDKIKKISPLLLTQLGVNLAQALNKEAFALFFRHIRIKAYDDISLNNQELLAKYLAFKVTVTKDTIKQFELNLYNDQGEEVYLTLSMQPLFAGKSYYGMVIAGELKSDFDRLKVERKLDRSQAQEQSLADKLVGLLEVTQDNLVFTDLIDKTIWLSTPLKNEMGLPDNTITMEQFRKLICEQDLITREQTIATLTPESPHFSVKYRLFYQGNYTWYNEVGKKIFTPGNTNIIASLTKINNRHFMASNIMDLDSLPHLPELIRYLNTLLSQKAYFEMIYLKVNNLADINTAHGREVGNMLLAQYVVKMKAAFKEEEANFFRITGSTFALVISDHNKINSFKSGVNRASDYLNLVAHFGGIDCFADVYAGVVVAKKDGFSAQELLTNAQQALHFALDKKYQGQVCFFSH